MKIIAPLFRLRTRLRAFVLASQGFSAGLTQTGRFPVSSGRLGRDGFYCDVFYFLFFLNSANICIVFLWKKA